MVKKDRKKKRLDRRRRRRKEETGRGKERMENWRIFFRSSARCFV